MSPTEPSQRWQLNIWQHPDHLVDISANPTFFYSLARPTGRRAGKRHVLFIWQNKIVLWLVRYHINLAKNRLTAVVDRNGSGNMHLPALGNNSSFLLRNALSLSSYEMLYLYLYLPALCNNLSLFLRNAYVFIFHKAANPKMHIFTLLWVLRSKVQIHCSWFSRDWRRNHTNSYFSG